MAYIDRIPNSRRLSIVAGVAAVHGAIGYLFVSGMAVEIAAKFVPTLTTTNIPIDMPLPPDTPPPPELPRTAARAPEVTVTTPLVEGPASTFAVTVDPAPPMAGTTTGAVGIAEPAPEPAPPPSLATGAKVRGDRGAWFTTDDYPAAAIRAEAEGTVAVSLALGPDGRVAACSVTTSSGSSALDQATCRLYRARARFTPARDAQGAAIASTYADRVRWQLPPR